jgi:hypothetical protein
VAVAVTITLVTWRYDRVVCLVTLPFVVGLTISTVYGRFHYGIDAASGVLAAVVLVVVANAVHHWLARIWSAQPGNAALELPV